MGVRLIREVLDHAPADLTTAERLALVVLAETANDTTREGWPGMETFARRAGLAPDSVQKVLRRLAARGLEVRVPVGTDASGRPLFACRGRQTTYRLPVLRGREGGTAVPPIDRERADHRPPNEARKGGPPSAQSEEKGRISVRERADQRPGMGGSSSAPSPQEPSRNPQQQAARIVIEHTGANADEAAAAVELIEREKQPRTLVPFVRRLGADGELPAFLDRARGEVQRQGISRWLASLADMPPCPDGQPGGDQRRPDTNEPQCALCRARGRRAA